MSQVQEYLEISENFEKLEKMKLLYLNENHFENLKRNGKCKRLIVSHKVIARISNIEHDKRTTEILNTRTIDQGESNLCAPISVCTMLYKSFGFVMHELFPDLANHNVPKVRRILAPCPPQDESCLVCDTVNSMFDPESLLQVLVVCIHPRSMIGMKSFNPGEPIDINQASHVITIINRLMHCTVFERAGWRRFPQIGKVFNKLVNENMKRLSPDYLQTEEKRFYDYIDAEEHRVYHPRINNFVKRDDFRTFEQGISLKMPFVVTGMVQMTLHSWINLLEANFEYLFQIFRSQGRHTKLRLSKHNFRFCPEKLLGYVSYVKK